MAWFGGPYLLPNQVLLGRSLQPVTRFRLRLSSLLRWEVHPQSSVWSDYALIEEDVKDYLQNHHALRTASGAFCSLCFVGKSETQVKAVVVVHCEDRSCRAQALQIIGNSPEWRKFQQDHPAFCLMSAPKAPSPRGLLAEGDGYMAYGSDDSDFSIGTAIRFGLQTDVRDQNEPRLARLGPTIFHKRQPYIISVSHQLRNFQLEDEESVKDNTPETFHSSSSFVSNLDEEGWDMFDAEDIFSTSGIATPAEDSLNASSEHDSMSLHQESEPIAVTGSALNLSISPIENIPMASMLQRVNAAEDSRNKIRTMEKVIGEVTYKNSDVPSKQHDWTLIKPSQALHEKMKRERSINTVPGLESSRSLVRITRAASNPGTYKSVWLVTSAGSCDEAVLSGSRCSYRLPRTQRFLDVLPVHTKRRLIIGESGTAVIDPEDGSWYGQIIAADDGGNVAYMLPADGIMESVAQALGITREYLTFSDESLGEFDQAKKIKRKDTDRIIALQCAIVQNDLAAAKSLFRSLQNSPNPGIDKVLAKALREACALDRFDFAKMFLENGVNADARVGSGETPLMKCVSKKMVELLVFQKADVNAVDNLGRTALMHAENVEVAEALVGHRASINEKDAEGRTALMHSSIYSDDSRIGRSLIQHGADLGLRDSQGRTALVLAAWKSQVSIVRELISKGASVKALDERGRNVLQHLCQDHELAKRCQLLESAGTTGADHEIIDLILGRCDEEDVNAREYLDKKSPLHWAVATNNLFLVRRLLSHTLGKAKVNALDQRLRTPLHIAAASNRTHIAIELLKHGANVNGKSDHGWTPLHVAADRRGESADIVRLLLTHGADVNCNTRTRKSALHAASEAGNIDVVKLLLAEKDIEPIGQDSSGNTPLLAAVKAGHKDTVKVLVQHDYRTMLSLPELEASYGYNASVIDFASSRSHTRTNNKTRNIRKWRPVYTLLNGDFPVTPKPHDNACTGANEPSGFRWIHLPANNVAWCQQILVRWFMEQKTPDPEHFKRLQASFNSEHSGRHLHTHYMRPACEVISRPNIDEDGSQGPAAAGSQRRKPKTNRNVEEAAPSTTSRTNTQLPAMYLFMPYVHFESRQAQERMQKTIDDAQFLKSNQIPGALQSYYPSRGVPLHQHQITNLEDDFEDADKRLIQADIQSSKSSLHIRRTLDQFFYRTIRTFPDRDTDQVVLRYQVNHEDRKDPHLLMVDQLWLWIVSEDLIITSFPKQWNEHDNDPKRHNVLESIVNEINSPTRSQHISDVHELAAIIAGHCSGAFDRRNTVSGQHLYMDMFESSIGDAMNHEVKLFREFEKTSKVAAEWLETAPGTLAQQSNLRKRSNVDQTAGKDNRPLGERWKSAFSSRLTLLQSLLDIKAETELLREIKDIRDELDILKIIFEQQDAVLEQMKNGIVGTPKQEVEASSPQTRIGKIFDEQRKYVKSPLQDIDRMDKQTEQVYKSITGLLELKQKHANAMQAVDTARHGFTLMVFTVVTVIFLPLSFLASFFALNINSYPHNAHGTPEMKLGYVSKYVFSIGLAIAALCVLFALYVERLYSLVKRWIWRASQRVAQWSAEEASKPSALEKTTSITFDARPYASSFSESTTSSAYALKGVRRSQSQNVAGRRDFERDSWRV